MSGYSVLLERDWLVATIRKLARHGAMASGFTILASRRFAACYRKNLLEHNALLHCQQHVSPHSVLPPRTRPVRLSVLLADCTRLHFPQTLESFPGRRDMERSITSICWAWIYISQETFSTLYFWIGLFETLSLESPVIRELFHGGALPHVTSLESGKSTVLSF